MAVWDCFDTDVSPDAADVATIRCLEPLFQNVVGAIMALVGVALFIVLIIGGYTYLFAGGDQKKLEKAKTTITGGLGGLIVVALSYFILAAVAEITGLPNLLIFKINFTP